MISDTLMTLVLFLNSIDSMLISSDVPELVFFFKSSSDWIRVFFAEIRIRSDLDLKQKSSSGFGQIRPYPNPFKWEEY